MAVSIDWNKVRAQAPGGASAWDKFAQGQGRNPYRPQPNMRQVYAGARAAAPGGPSAWDAFAKGAGPNPYAGGGQQLSLASAYQAPGGGSYDDQFKQSLLKSRAAIDQQFQSALSDISQREGSANQALGLLPGQVQGVYDRGNANLAQAQGTLDTAQKATGLQSFAPAAAQMAPISAAIGQDLAARQADVPLLKLGSAQVFTQQRGALGQARLGAQDQLDSEERGYAADRAKSQDEQAFQLMMQERQQDSDLAGRNWLAEQDFARQKQAASEEAAAALREEGRSLNTFGAADTSAERGQWLRNYDSKTYDRIVGSDAYREAERFIRGNSSARKLLGEGGSVQAAIDMLKKRGLYRTAAALAYRHTGGPVGAPVAPKQ